MRRLGASDADCRRRPEPNSSQRELLPKAEAEIESGRHRVAGQKLVKPASLWTENCCAERLNDLLKRLLAERERRRELIAQRIDHLEREIWAPQP
jgi:hypothetical protein